MPKWPINVVVDWVIGLEREYLARVRSCRLSRARSMHPDFEKASLELKYKSCIRKNRKSAIDLRWFCRAVAFLVGCRADSPEALIFTPIPQQTCYLMCELYQPQASWPVAPSVHQACRAITGGTGYGPYWHPWGVHIFSSPITLMYTAHVQGLFS